MVKLISKLGIVAIVTFTILGCDNSKVSNVKNAVLPDYSKNITIEQAINSWSKTQECSEIKWEEIVSVQGAKIVQVICNLDLSKLQTKEDMADNTNDEALKKEIDDYNKIFSDYTNAQDAVTNATTNYNDLLTRATTDHYAAKAYREGMGVLYKSAIDEAKSDANKATVKAQDAGLRLHEIIEHVAARNLKKAEIIFQFNISHDGKTITSINQIGDFIFKDEKKSEFKSNLKDAYNNVKQDIHKELFSYIHRK